MLPTKSLAGFLNETEANSDELVNEEVAISVRKSAEEEYQLIIDDGTDERWYQMSRIDVNTLIVALQDIRSEGK